MSRWLCLLCLLLGCGETGRERVTVALFARGTAARTLTLADASVTLTRADVALGPLYFCASELGRAELCEVAVVELLSPVLLSALEPTTQLLGELDATTGNIASAIYDYGISWLLTEPQPRAGGTAPGGHSAVLEGTVTRAGRSLRFTINVDAKPRVRGDLTVNAQRTSHVLTREGEQLTLTVDPNSWVDRLDIDALFALDADGDGSVLLPVDSTLYESVLQGMLNRTPVGFVWN
jgi:hypothetical protein